MEKEMQDMAPGMQDKEEKQKRDFGLDAVRCLALVLVMITHSIIKSEAYDYTGVQASWVATMVVFYLSHSSVPLFLLLSGYLCGKKELCGKYFTKLPSVLIPYVVISLLCLADAVFRQGDTGLGPLLWIYQILSFTANGYAWYVEMYVGLFLLIPFLNILYHALETPKRKLSLLVVLTIMTMLPDVVSCFGTHEILTDVLPDYWNICYPVTYYFLGMMLREYGDRLRGKICWGLLALGWLFPAVTCVVRSWLTDSYRGGNTFNTFGCLFTALAAIALFQLVRRLPQKGRAVGAIAANISKSSLEMYLCSYLFDMIFYSYLSLPFPAMVVLTFCGSWALAQIVRLVTVPCGKLCQHGLERLIQKPAKT